LKAVGESGVVFAFEPNRLQFECLKQNCPTALCYQKALGAAEGKAKLFPDDKNIGASWLDPMMDGEIEVVTLDSYDFRRLNLLKIDVEGMELDVIRGATATIKRCRPILFLELNQGTLKRRGETVDNLIKLITGLEYRMKFLHESHSLDLPQVDVIFEPIKP